jgi:O-methyltransferase
MDNARALVRSSFPKLYESLRLAKHPSERAALDEFVASAPPGKNDMYRQLAKAFRRAHTHILTAHLHAEFTVMAKFLMQMPASVPGVIVEAGCYQDGSAAKLSHICAALNRKLILFDSFEGIPQNLETHAGGDFITFKPGDYSGTLAQVQANIAKYGRIEVCEFRKGWFEDTMPGFREPIAAAFIDVDLAASTKTCLKYLFLSEVGALFSHDGHLKMVADVFDDDAFWRSEVGCAKPTITGLRQSKLIQAFR